MAVSRRKKLERERELKALAMSTKREKKFVSQTDKSSKYNPIRTVAKKYYRNVEEVPSYEPYSFIDGTARDKNVYSGEYVTGLAVMHKSNIVPVGRDDDAVSYAQMRRN